MDHPHHIERPENPELSPREVYARASEELQQQFDDLELQITRGEINEANTWEALTCVARYADYAATRQDSEVVERCVELTKFFTGEGTMEKTDIYLSGLLVGNLESSQALHSALEEEKQAGESRVLDNVVKSTIARGTDPAAWIQHYSGNSQQELDLTLETQRRMSQSNNFSEGERAMHQASYAETLGRLYSGENTCEVDAELLARELDAIESPARRRELVDRHLKTFLDTSEISWGLYESHLAIAKSTLENPYTESEEDIEQFVESVQTFSSSIENLGEAFREINSDFVVTTAQLPWLLTLKEYADRPSPQELVEYLDVQIGAMINTAKIEEEKIYDDRTMSVMLRDKLLSGLAEQYAQKGDFESSAKVVGNIADEEVCEETLQKSLSHATALSQVQEMGADELLFMFHPNLQLYVEAAAASSVGAVAAAVELSTDLIQREDWPVDKSAFLQMLYQDLGEDPRFAKQVLTIERQLQKPSSRDDVFSRDLIRGGDQEEPGITYTEALACRDSLLRFGSLLYLLQDLETQGD